MGEKLRRILPKVATSTSLFGSFTCRKFTTWDRRLYFPSEGRRAEDFFARKIRRLRPGLNPRTRVPKASTLSSRPPKPLSKSLVSLFTQNVGRDSSVGRATRYGMDGPGIEYRWGRDFPHLSRPALRRTQPPKQWVPGLSQG